MTVAKESELNFKERLAQALRWLSVNTIDCDEVGARRRYLECEIGLNRVER